MMRFFLNILCIVLIFSVGYAVGLGKIPGAQIHSPLFPYVLQAQLTQCELMDEPPMFFGSDLERCYITRLAAIVRQFGMAHAVSAFRRYMNVNPKGVYLQGQRCHALAHEVGNAAARTGVPAPVLLAQCIDMCAERSSRQPIEEIDLGCMNGAAHTWVLLNPDVRKVSAMCDEGTVSEDIRDGCFHGIGHGLTEKYAGNIEQSVSECAKLPSDRARFQCAHAVFMAGRNVILSGRVPDNMVAYCRGILPEMAKSCYEFAGSIDLYTTKDVAHALDVCESVSSEFIKPCRERVGEGIFLSRGSKNDMPKCLTGRVTEAIRACIHGFVRASVDNVNDTYGSTALLSCQMVGDEYKNTCYARAGMAIRDAYSEEVRKRSCETVSDPNNRDVCLTDMK